MADELVSFRYIVDGRTCLDWYVLNVGDERKRTRLSGRSAASWERTAEELLSGGRLSYLLLLDSTAVWAICDFGVEDRGTSPAPNRWERVRCADVLASTRSFFNCRRRKERTSPLVSFAVTGGCSTRWWMSWRGEFSCSLATWPFPIAATAVAALRTWWMRKN